ncbi:glycoside hydrolase family 2 TIM barrel-domain containing protein [Lutibacter citreus]|uniref:glycoside hydrolase family 2 TIM barrel-domain containing protein n=1 Tax=Lutibacter citreus TaxID=2138210 RepID=UPI000DBE2DFA|nr:glycoside hydrolase family 2 TIM barrel-domain containing protein [Lutibacter citreus]
MKFYKIILLVVVGVFISCGSRTDINEVSISNKKLLVNNKQYLIKGICYHPVSKGKVKRSFEKIDEDLALMKEANINTIRVYEPIDNEDILDKINSAGIKVIIGFGYDQDGVFDIKSGTFIDYVNKYKHHKAILLWELGNEYNYHPEWFKGDINNWYLAMDKAAQLIHNNDSNHPVSTAHGELPSDLVIKSCPNIDVWGMNVYRWDNPTTIFSEWENISSKPMYLSEAGGDSYMTITKEGFNKGNNEKAQAAANRSILKAVFKNTEIGIGVTMFSFTDGWWKTGNPSLQDVGGWAPNSSGIPYDGSPNEEYWGIVDIDRNKKLTFDVLKQAFK